MNLVVSRPTTEARVITPAEICLARRGEPTPQQSEAYAAFRSPGVGSYTVDNPRARSGVAIHLTTSVLLSAPSQVLVVTGESTRFLRDISRTVERFGWLKSVNIVWRLLETGDASDGWRTRSVLHVTGPKAPFGLLQGLRFDLILIHTRGELKVDHVVRLKSRLKPTGKYFALLVPQPLATV